MFKVKRVSKGCGKGSRGKRWLAKAGIQGRKKTDGKKNKKKNYIFFYFL